MGFHAIKQSGYGLEIYDQTSEQKRGRLFFSSSNPGKILLYLTIFNT
jgi:hypothetical protein